MLSDDDGARARSYERIAKALAKELATLEPAPDNDLAQLEARFRQAATSNELNDTMAVGGHMIMDLVQRGYMQLGNWVCLLYTSPSPRD